MSRRILSLALVLAVAATALSQTVEKKDPDQEAAKLQENAVALLRETMGDVSALRTSENRISFSAELASLMWFHDETEARSMFGSAMSDFRQLLSVLDQQMRMFPADQEYQRYSMFGDQTGRRRIEQKFRIAMGLRQQIASSIAEHDGDLAINFYRGTAVNPEGNPLAKLLDNDDSFEFTLFGKIAANNAAKAAANGKDSLSKGVKDQHIDLLRKIYQKDPDSAVEFGAAILSKLVNDPKKTGLFTLGSLLEFGSENLEAAVKSGKPAVYTEGDLRDLAGILADWILGGDSTSGFGLNYISLIEKYQPGRALQITAKYKTSKRGSGSGNGSGTGSGTYAPPPTYKRPVSTTGVGVSPEKSQDPQELEKEKLMKDVAKLDKSELPKEERDKIIARARTILRETPAIDQKITGLSLLAATVARAGDKDLAAEIMRDAEALVNPSPKNYRDFILTWMLASGYAESDPTRAFPLIEGAVGRVNDLIASLIRIGEFVDADEEMIVDGEVQIGGFGGGMIRGITGMTSVATPTVLRLAIADFPRLKALTNRFERPEARVLAKMIVLRAVFESKELKRSDEQTTIKGNAIAH